MSRFVKQGRVRCGAVNSGTVSRKCTGDKDTLLLLQGGHISHAQTRKRELFLHMLYLKILSLSHYTQGTHWKWGVLNSQPSRSMGLWCWLRTDGADSGSRENQLWRLQLANMGFNGVSPATQREMLLPPGAQGCGRCLGL